jgi:hypothetical protein
VLLDPQALASVLERAPMEFSEEASGAGVELPLPMPDGRLGRFRVVESPILAPAVAQEFADASSVGVGTVSMAAGSARNLADSGLRAPAWGHGRLLAGRSWATVLPSGFSACTPEGRRAEGPLADGGPDYVSSEDRRIGRSMV